MTNVTKNMDIVTIPSARYKRLHTRQHNHNISALFTSHFLRIMFCMLLINVIKNMKRIRTYMRIDYSNEHTNITVAQDEQVIVTDETNQIPGREVTTDLFVIHNIVVVPSKCKEEPISNISTTTLSIAPPLPTSFSTNVGDQQQLLRRQYGDYPNYNSISELVEGPAMTYRHRLRYLANNSNIDDDENLAICKFRYIKFSNHFPHTMQQLYRCWSWWIANNDKSPVLVLDRNKLKPGFAHGFLSVLEVAIDLQIVPDNYTDDESKRQYVQAKDTTMFESDVALTDYAMIDPNRTLRETFAKYIPKLTMDTQCSSSTDSTNVHRKPKISILNRDTRTGRHLHNAPQIAKSIEQTFVGQNVSIVQFEGQTTLEQIKFFMETDIVISPHGAQLTGIGFMKSCSTVIEFFPKLYVVPDYFGSLAAAVNVDHRFFYFTDTEDHEIQPYERFNHFTTIKYRKNNQCPPLDSVMKQLTDVIAQWRPCCGGHLDSKITTEKQLSLKLRRDHQNKQGSADTFIASIDVVSIGSNSRIDQLNTQQQTFGSHRYVRNFIPVTELNDNDKECAMINKQQEDFVVPICKSRKVSVCSQKRTINGLLVALDQYKNGTVSTPDYLILIKDDTYLDIDALAEEFYESYPSDNNYLITGCTSTFKIVQHIKSIAPIVELASFMTRATIKKIITPIYCNSDMVNNSATIDPFTRWACWRMNYNTVGELEFFKDGMSISDLIHAYISGLPRSIVERQNSTNFCFYNSDHALAYFLNFYHVSVPNWILQESHYTDNVRSQHSFKKLNGNFENGHSGRGGECNNWGTKCTGKSRLCRNIDSEAMLKIYHQQQSK